MLIDALHPRLVQVWEVWLIVNDILWALLLWPPRIVGIRFLHRPCVSLGSIVECAVWVAPAWVHDAFNDYFGLLAATAVTIARVFAFTATPWQTVLGNEHISQTSLKLIVALVVVIALPGPGANLRKCGDRR
jgi:hypothetical protein